MFLYVCICTHFSGRIPSKLLMMVLLEKEIGKLVCVGNKDVFTPVFLFQGTGEDYISQPSQRGDLTTGNVGRGMCCFSSKATPRQCESAPLPQPPTAPPSERLGLKNFETMEIPSGSPSAVSHSWRRRVHCPPPHCDVSEKPAFVVLSH